MTDKIDNSVSYPEFSKQQHQRGENVFGAFKTVSAAPTAIPRNWFEQIQLYVNGSTVKLYVYDFTNAVWRPIWMGDLVSGGHTTISQSSSQITISSS